MRSLCRVLALSALAPLCAVPSLQAQSPLTVTCTGPYNTFTANVYQLYIDTSLASQFYFTIYTDLSKYNESLDNEYFSNAGFDQCVFSPSNGTTPENASIADTALSVSAAGAYTEITFTFNLLSVGPESRKLTAPAAKAPLTREEAAKELAAYKSTVPALKLNK